MKGKRLADVLDERFNSTEMTIYNKFCVLHKRMTDTNPDIDNTELRWVEHKIEQMEENDDGYEPTKNDLLQANLYWKKWENK